MLLGALSILFRLPKIEVGEVCNIFEDIYIIWLIPVSNVLVKMVRELVSTPMACKLA